MAASSDLTLEHVADGIANRAYLTATFGPVTSDLHIKTAAWLKQAAPKAFNRPESWAQAIQFLRDTPQVARPDGGVMADPVWGTAQKALIGAGLGAGAGGLSAMLNNKRRRHWLRNMMLGGLLGGGIGGGLGAMYHGSAANAAGSAEGVAQQNIDRLNAELAGAARGKPLPEGTTMGDLRTQKAYWETQLPGRDNVPTTPVSAADRLTHAVDQVGDGTGAGWLEALDIMTPHKATGALTAAAGGATGLAAGAYDAYQYDKALAKHQTDMTNHSQHTADLKNMDFHQRMGVLPDADWKATFGKNWQQAKQQYLNAPPGDAKNPLQFSEAFPSLVGQQQVALSPQQFNNFKTRVTKTPAAPSAPVKPLSGRVKGTVGLFAGGLLPQLPYNEWFPGIENMFSHTPSKPAGPASPY